MNNGDKPAEFVMHDLIPKHPMNFGRADGLYRFNAQYRFFTPAMPYLFGGFSDALWLSFMETCAKPPKLMHHRFERPIFRGMETLSHDPDWNHVLWAVEAEQFEPLENYLLSLAVQDPGSATTRSSITRFPAQDVAVVDPLMNDKVVAFRQPVPLLTVVVFGVDATWGRVAIDPADVAYLTPAGPRAKYFPPAEHSATFAARLLAGDASAADALPKNSTPAPRLDSGDRPARHLPKLTADEVQHAIEEYHKEFPQ